MAKTSPRAQARIRRKKHIRKQIRGDADRPRLTVFRSANHIYAQIVDDRSGATLAAASTMSSELKDLAGHRGNKIAAKAVGELIAQKAGAVGVKAVRFDRNGYLFHGRVKALADAAREGGLDF